MRARLTDFFGLDERWQRPLPELWWRTDLLVCLATMAVSAFVLEAARSAYLLEGDHHPAWQAYVALLVTAGLLGARRRFPLTSVTLVAASMFVTGLLMPKVMVLMPLQYLYLTSFFSAAAWGRPRRRTHAVLLALIVFMHGWVVWQLTLGGGVDEASRKYAHLPSGGLIPLAAAVAITSIAINVVFFFGAWLGGCAVWRTARERAVVTDQARTIAHQSEGLRDQAVLDERLRIARELHDVVAHHVAVMGVQAGAARKLLGKRPEAAEEPLRQVESSAREAVSEMRSLLGTLRSSDDPGGSRQPGLGDLPALLDDIRAGGLEVDVDDSTWDPDAVPDTLGLTVYRLVQEALANVRRHSTASRATVVLGREGGPDPVAVVEVLDEGDPVPGSSGSQVGQVGMRERVEGHGGTLRTGPRPVRGYRVRAVLPLPVDRERMDA